MKLGIDTNVLVYASFSACPQYQDSINFLSSLHQARHQAYTSWMVLYEYLAVTTSVAAFQDEPFLFGEALQNVMTLIEDHDITLLGENIGQLEFLQQWQADLQFVIKGTRFHDCHYAALLLSHTIHNIVTYDAGFKVFPGLQVFKPDEL